MKCVPRETGISILDEIHSGSCGNHAASRTLIGRAFRVGFYWPKAKEDVETLVQHCQSCQFFAKQQIQPASLLQNISLSWPFACWGLDMICPFKKAQGGYDHILVAVDKFTKWIEFKPINTLKASKAAEFIQDIIFRFGVPSKIITDLGTNFTGSDFSDFCDNWGIEICYASVAHPKGNGQVERANGMILQGLKSRIYDALKPYENKWIKELPYVIWGLRTQPSRGINN